MEVQGRDNEHDRDEALSLLAAKMDGMMYAIGDVTKALDAMTSAFLWAFMTQHCMGKNPDSVNTDYMANMCKDAIISIKKLSENIADTRKEEAPAS